MVMQYIFSSLKLHWKVAAFHLRYLQDWSWILWHVAKLASQSLPSCFSLAQFPPFWSGLLPKSYLIWLPQDFLHCLLNWFTLLLHPLKRSLLTFNKNVLIFQSHLYSSHLLCLSWSGLTSLIVNKFTFFHMWLLNVSYVILWWFP